MKKKLAKKYISLKIIKPLIILGALFLFISCQSRSEKLYALAYEKINKNQFVDAILLLESSVELEKDNIKRTKAQFEAARLLRFELQDYDKALILLRAVVLQSQDSKMRLLAQESICEIYFDHLQNYHEALNELLILEPLLSDAKKEIIRLKIAQSQRFLGNYQAALEYIEVALKSSEAEKYSFLKLKAQIFQSQQKFDESIKILEEIYKNNKKYFIDENLHAAISNIHEEKKDYKIAIEYLEKNANEISNKNYLELRIKKMKEKQINKPFSRGVRK